MTQIARFLFHQWLLLPSGASGRVVTLHCVTNGDITR